MSALPRLVRLHALTLVFAVALVVSGCDVIIGGQANGGSPTSTPISAAPTPPSGATPTKASPTPTPTPPKLNREVVRTTTTVARGAGFAAHVKCPAGKVPLGGGYYADLSIVVTASYPIEDASNPTSNWEVYGKNQGVTTHSLYAYAVCVIASAAQGWEVVRRTDTVGAGAGLNADVACPAGKVAVGGGYYPDPGFFSSNSAPPRGIIRDSPTADASQSSHWQIYGHNYAGSTQSIYVYAVCVNASAAPSREVVRTPYNVATGAAVVDTVQCPTGKVAVGGGYYVAGWFGVNRDSPSADATLPREWAFYGRNYESSAQTVDIYAVCITG